MCNRNRINLNPIPLALRALINLNNWLKYHTLLIEFPRASDSFYTSIQSVPDILKPRGKAIPLVSELVFFC